jgi:hypothetical protein
MKTKKLMAIGSAAVIFSHVSALALSAQGIAAE